MKKQEPLKMIKHCTSCGAEFFTLLRFKNIKPHKCPKCKTNANN